MRDLKGSVIKTSVELAGGASLRGRSVIQAAVIKACQELSAVGAVTVRIDPDPDITADSYRVTFEIRPEGCVS